MKIVQLVRNGSGALEEGLSRFEWSGTTHSSMQGTLDLELMSKTVRKEMPGSNEVVEQKMSSTWQPFEMNGEWDDKWAGAGFAMDMFNDFAIFAEKTPYVRFTLDKHSIQGLLTNFKVKYKTASKISWTITISPHKNDTFTANTGTSIDFTRKSIDQWWKQFQLQLAALNVLRAQRPKIPMATSFTDKFDSLLSAVNSALTAIGNIATNGLQSNAERELLKAASLFRRVRGAALDAFFNTRQAANAIDVAKNDVLGTLNYDSWIHPATQQFWIMMGEAKQAEVDMLTRVGLYHPIAVYRPLGGESLERISQKFYGTPDNASLIYDANHLSSVVLDGNELLTIPAMSNQ